jgi:hypothetical protein
MYFQRDPTGLTGSHGILWDPTGLTGSYGTHGIQRDSRDPMGYEILFGNTQLY